MPTSVNECFSIIDQFKRAHPELLMQIEYRGVRVMCPEDRLVLTILLTGEIGREFLELDEEFNYQFEDRQGTIPIQFKPASLAKAHVVCQPGDPASGAPQSYYGTLGWNFYLNNVLVGLSNWHVFCPQGNSTPIGWRETINGSVEATLYAFQDMYPTGNTWDYALAQYIQPADAAGTMRPCDNGVVGPYPGALSPLGSVQLGDGATYSKDGARPPICRTGTLTSVGDAQVKYDDGSIRSFHYQLFFSKMTDPGDSGAVIVRLSDNTVTGLNFAGDDQETIANPIYEAGWRRTGSIKLDGGFEVPMLVGNAVPPTLNAENAYNAPVALPNQFDVQSARHGLSEIRPLDGPPNLSAGLLFLGWGLHVQPSHGGAPYYQQGTPPPPPIRPGVQVQVIPASTTESAQGWIFSVQLYFG